MSAFRRMDAGLAQRFDRGAGHLVALDTSDDLLDVRIEILHPDRGAVHARLGQRGDARLVDLVRVDLDRELGVRREGEGFLHRGPTTRSSGRATKASACRHPSEGAPQSTPAGIRAPIARTSS